MEQVRHHHEQAKQEYRSRSELFREAIRAYILKRQTWNEIFSFGQKQARKLGIKSEEDIFLFSS